ncbi:lytic transglycosylase [Teredinibacter waterburyi]|jgi:Soluble lytic murein transglycosylase and related regulatory proteins (some contain LysM/invasin domains)|uniref:lytic transglycosylase n=1 Tax=Teredinibacter waterburyi TaxID=1500538 RepID=UPI00165FBE7D|nr:LysM peptidoglycan-binding domain-containing protein [Teredinibacter waterburyi]
MQLIQNTHNRSPRPTRRCLIRLSCWFAHRPIQRLTIRKPLTLIGLLSCWLLSGCGLSQLISQPLTAEQSPVAEHRLTAEPDDELSEAELDSITPLAPTNVIDRITAGYGLPLDINKRVQQQIDWFARHPNYLSRVLSRGEPYLYYIVEELEKNNLPLELAYLPIVESAFDPFAYSHGRASGMWQFVPGTGKAYGQKQNWWYDGRRDVIAATEGAVAYLKHLNNRFDGDWLQALASYNSGAGNVSKAIRKNKKKGKPTDFWNLNLPRETEAYVPKLIALAILFQNPDDYGIKLPEIANEPYFAVVDTTSQIDLAQAADLAGIDIDTLYYLNPGFNRWATDPAGPHRLLVPLANEQEFITNLAAIPSSSRVTWERYTIKNGDTVSTIAAKYKLDTPTLKSINNLKSNNIRAGKTLLVPVASAGAEHYRYSQTQRLAAKQEKGASKNKSRIDHEVQPGESFWTISRKYKVSTGQIARWNNMAPSDPIFPGQRLAIWTKIITAPTTGATKTEVRKVTYKVRNGDSLHRIADKFQLSVTDILSWNSVSTSKYLQPGQLLTLFVNVTGAR